MNTITKGDLKTTLAAAADALIAERRQKEGWRHLADDLIVQMANARRSEFRIGVAVGISGSMLAGALLWLALP